MARIVGHEAIWSPAIPQRVIFNQAIGERRSIHSYAARAAEPIAVFDALWRRVRLLTNPATEIWGPANQGPEN